MKNLLILLFFVTSLFSQESYYYKNGKKVFLKKVTTLSRSHVNIDYYTNSVGIVLGVSDKIIVQLKLHDNLDKYMKLYDLSLKKVIGKNLYLLKVHDKSLTLKIANALSHKEDVVYAQPDFIKKSLRR